MDKKKFTVIRSTQKADGDASESIKKQELVSEKWLRYLENEDYQLIDFDAGADHAAFTFTYGEYELKFLLDFIVDTIILDFDGAGLPEAVRLEASTLLEKIVETLRFRHKDKYWSLSHYYVADKAEYEARKNEAYPEQYEEDWKRIVRLTKMEVMDDTDRLLMEVEDVHDLELNIVGEDGKILCAYLKEMGLITYQQSYENQWKIEFLDAKGGLDTINRKIIFAREVAYYGYNIWVDYPE